MNDTSIKTPTLVELTAAGYSINIEHNRRHKVAFLNGEKMIVREAFTNELNGIRRDSEVGITTLLPKGGMTEIWVTDPETSAEFYGFARCHPDDNYDKHTGINEALKRVAALMLVMDGTDGFKCRLQL
jgi:hypothetical protein